MRPYTLFTDSAANLTEGLECPGVEVIKMEVEGADEDLQAFYRHEREGRFYTTTQINPLVYRKAFKKVLDAGRDLMYLSFSSGLSGTYASACLCAQELREDYPDRKIVCVDTLCASAGEGFLVYEAVRKQKEGISLSDLEQWIEENRLHVCHYFTVDGLTALNKGGRVEQEIPGHLLNIKPLLQVDNEGRLAVTKKLRGAHMAEAELAARMKAGWAPERGRLVVIAHADNPEGAERLRARICRECPEAEVRTTTINTVIGAHTGPGMLAVLCWGEKR